MWVQFGYIVKDLGDIRVIGIKAVDPVSLDVANIGLANTCDYDIVYLNGFKKYIENKEVTRVLIGHNLSPMYSGNGLDLTDVGYIVGDTTKIKICSGCLIEDINGNLLYKDELSKLKGYLRPYIMIDNLLGICYNSNLNRFDYIINHHFVSDFSYIDIYGFGNILENKELTKEIYKKLVKSKSKGFKCFINGVHLIKVPSGKCKIEIQNGCKLVLFDLSYCSRPILSNNEIVIPLSVCSIDDSVFMMRNSKLFISKLTNPRVIANLMLKNVYLEDYRNDIINCSSSLINIVNLFNQLIDSREIEIQYID